MALDPVPWAVGGGAEHSPEVARVATYALSSGAEGIVEPGDLAVKALSVPAASVRVSVGSALIRSGAASGVRQTYVGRAQSATDVAIAPNTGSSTRNDLIILRVEDPFAGGTPWQDPADPAAGPYLFLRVVSGVRSDVFTVQEVPGHETDSAVTLAMVSVPPSTATITNAMIEDRRQIAIPRRHESIYARPRAVWDEGVNLVALNSAGGEAFPGLGVDNGAPWVLPIPEWATSATIDADWMGIRYAAGKDPYGVYWIEFGDERRSDWPNGQRYEFRTEKFAFNSPGGSAASRDNWRLVDRVNIPKKLRGKSIFFTFCAGYTNTNKTAGDVRMDAQGGLAMRILLEQIPEIDY